jgi:SAM-dependent methyltransferase
MTARDPYYRDDLALVHHLGYGFHADTVGPPILTLLEEVRARGGLVLELGCGSGLLTRHLTDAGHRVIATDASPAMLELARGSAPEAEEFRLLVMPDDPMPEADAVVSVGHPVSYLPDEESLKRAFAQAAQALRPGGVMAIDVCDLRWGELRKAQLPQGRVGEDWAIVTVTSVPTPDRFVREMTTFLRNDDQTWRRDDERHDNVLIDTSTLPALLAEHGVDATVGPSFGTEHNPDGLVCVVGHKRA